MSNYTALVRNLAGNQYGRVWRVRASAVRAPPDGCVVVPSPAILRRLTPCALHETAGARYEHPFVRSIRKWPKQRSLVDVFRVSGPSGVAVFCILRRTTTGGITLPMRHPNSARRCNLPGETAIIDDVLPMRLGCDR